MSKRGMITLGAVLALLLATGVSAAGSRQLRAMHMAPVGAPMGSGLPSAAPAPAPFEPPADIVFTLTAPSAVLKSDSLTLNNVAAVVQSFSHGAKTSIYKTADFADARPGARFVSPTGRWLDNPVAALEATSGGRMVSALVSLADPHYDATSQALTFKAVLLPATPDTLLPGGAADRLAANAAAGLPINLLLEAPAAGLQLDGVGLFIDQSTTSLGAAGVTESMMVGDDGSRSSSRSSDSHGYHEGHRDGDSWYGGSRDCSGWGCSGWGNGWWWGGSRDGDSWNSGDSSRSWDSSDSRNSRDSSRSWGDSDRDSSGNRGYHSDGRSSADKSG